MNEKRHLVLRITPSADAESALSYFDNGLRQGDYYSTEQEADSFWGGALGLGLGVYAPNEKVAPTREQFERLAHNQHPVTGERLTARTKSNRRVGYDFTFNAPKSLSIASEVLGQEAVRTSFVGAVETTMKAIEADMMARVRKNNQNTNRVTQNMLYAGFVHRTSRPVGGIADPHLHAHCFLFNVTHDQSEQQFKAAEIGYIMKNAPYYEAMFHSYLAEKLVELGYNIERNGRYVELAGMTKDLIERYSRRTKQIEELAELKGIVDAEEKAKLGEKTRENKSANTKDGNELIESWKSRLATSEEKLFIPSVPMMDRQAPSLKDEVLTKAIEHVFERKSIVSDKELLAEALRLSYGTATIEDLKAQLADRDDLMQEADGHGKAIMSKDVLKEEQAIVDFAQKSKDRCEAFSPTTQVNDKFLNKGQKEAITKIWQSKDFITVLEGGAGVGKTTLAKIAVAGIEEQGQKVHMFAPSAQASRGVLRADGFKDANTVASLLHSQKKQNSLKNQVIWIDEAGLLGTPTLHKVLSIAGKQNARVVLSGDAKQHKGVERGDALSLLYDHAGIQPIQVNEIVRQKGAYKNVVGAIQDGNVAEGFGRLNLMGGIIEDESEVGRHQAINNHYLSAVIKKESVLIVAPTHAEKDKVTASLRSHLKVMRRIGTEEKTLATLKGKGLTKGEKQDPLLYKTGTVIQFNKATTDKIFKNKQQVTVVSPAGADSLNVVTPKGENKVLKLAEHENFAVYERKTLDVTDGEKIRITDNGSVKDEHGKSHRLNNGATYTVKKFQYNGDLLLTNGWILPKDYGHIDYGYCSTSHSSQGKTVDHVIIAESEQSFGAATKEQFYVSASRGRKTCKVFTDNKEALLETVSNIRTTNHALDMWKGKQVTPSRRMQAVLTREQFLKSMPKQTTLHVPKAQFKQVRPSLESQERLERSRQQEVQVEIDRLNSLRNEPPKPAPRPERVKKLHLDEHYLKSLDELIHDKVRDLVSDEAITIGEFGEIEVDWSKVHFTKEIDELEEEKKQLETFVEFGNAREEVIEALAKKQAKKLSAKPSPELQKRLKQQKARRKEESQLKVDDLNNRQKQQIQAKIDSMPKQSTQDAPLAQSARQALQDELNNWQGKETKPSKNGLRLLKIQLQTQQKKLRRELTNWQGKETRPSGHLRERIAEVKAEQKKLRQDELTNWQGKEVRPSKQLRTYIAEIKVEAEKGLNLLSSKMSSPYRKKKHKVEKFSVPEMSKDQNKKSSRPPVTPKVEKTTQSKIDQDKDLELELSLEPEFE